MNRCFARSISAALVVATTALSFPMGASARVVGTEEAARTEATAPGTMLDRGALRAMFERDDVRAQLQAHGVDPRLARERVDALTDEEVAKLAGQVGTLPAGADASVIGVLFTVFIILLVTDILGLTKIFPFTRSVR
jgi:hypothetical protein